MIKEQSFLETSQQVWKIFSLWSLRGRFWWLLRSLWIIKKNLLWHMH